MSTLSTTNIKHPSSGSNNLVLTSGGATQIAGLTYPTADGSNGQYLRTNGSGALSFATVTTGTQWTNGSIQTLSGTDITFSSIPSNAVFIQITILQMSFNGTSDLRIRLGDSGGEESTGYVGRSYATSSVATMATNAFGFEFTNAAAYIYSGKLEFWNHNGNTWISEGRIHQETANDYMGYTGRKSLSDALTQIRLFGSGGHSFDNGSVTLHYLTA